MAMGLPQLFAACGGPQLLPIAPVSKRSGVVRVTFTSHGEGGSQLRYAGVRCRRLHNASIGRISAPSSRHTCRPYTDDSRSCLLQLWVRAAQAIDRSAPG